MYNVSIDFETYSEANIGKLGVWAYSCHPSTEVICMAYSIDGAEPILWLPGEPIPEFFHDRAAHIHAWNSFFEVCIIFNVLGLDLFPPSRVTDTAALAAAMSLPRALGNCARVMGLPEDQQKDKRGKYLIQRLCKPYRGKRNRDPELLQELYDYCLQDVVTEQAVASRLKPLNKIERQVWELDMLVNTRGIPVDRELVDKSLSIIDTVTSTLNAEVVSITNNALENTAKVAKVKEYAGSLGYPMTAFTKQYIIDSLQNDELPPVLRRVLEIRQQLGKTSTAKYTSFNNLTAHTPRVHGALMYHGANTGRWSGRLVQTQNFPRGSVADTESCIEVIKQGDSDLLEMLYDDPMEAMSSCLRGCIKAKEGHRLIVSDYSAIEARVLAWVAGQEDVLDVFRGDGKIYEMTASKIYGVPVSEVTKEQRFVGKTSTLACGYQGGYRAFLSMAEAYGVKDISEDRAKKIVKDWRTANPMIVKLWDDVEGAVIKAIQSKKLVNLGKLAFKVRGNFLFLRLPSGRCLAYCRPEVHDAGWKQEICYQGTNSVTRKWEKLSIYGGLLVENLTQAIARDLMAEAMLRIEGAGYPIIMSVHDELVAEVPNGFGTQEEFDSLMCVLPDWAEGMPVDAEGFESQIYKK